MTRRHEQNAGLFGEQTVSAETDTWTAFETFFWQHYPKKVGKLAAKREWDKLKPSQALCRKIREALAWQVTQRDWTKDRGQWIPEPRKWLYHGRWEDEPPQIQTRSAPWWESCAHEPRCETLYLHQWKVSRGVAG